MLSVHLALILIVVLAAFAAAWRWMPSGYLTASMTSLGGLLVVAHQTLGDSMMDLQAVLPEEYRPLLSIAFVVLTVMARFRTWFRERSAKVSS